MGTSPVSSTSTRYYMEVLKNATFGPFLLRTGASGGGLGGTTGVRPPSPVAGSRLSSEGPFLDAGRTRGWSSSSPEATT